MKSQPYTTVVAGSVVYSAIFHILTRNAPLSELRTRVKTISATHSFFTTALCLYLLEYGEWPVKGATIIVADSHPHKLDAITRLADSKNPIIAGKNSFANALTAWEAGYLVYDTGALLAEAHLKYNTKGAISTIITLSWRSPVFLAHHLALISAFMYLQYYVANDREKGVWVIIAMLAMNASNPLLHLRWYLKRRNGKGDRRVDVALAIVFAVSRFGNVYFILKKYGDYHAIGAWEAIARQRTQCKVGTGILTGVNAVWWVGLVRSILRRTIEA